MTPGAKHRARNDAPILRLKLASRKNDEFTCVVRMLSDPANQMQEKNRSTRPARLMADENDALWHMAILRAVIRNLNREALML